MTNTKWHIQRALVNLEAIKDIYSADDLRNTALRSLVNSTITELFHAFEKESTN